MAITSLYTQMILLCFYSSFTFVYLCLGFRMVTSVSCQETNWLYCIFLYWQKIIFFFCWSLSNTENWRGHRGLGWCDPPGPLPPSFFLPLCYRVCGEASAGFRQRAFIFFSAPVLGQRWGVTVLEKLCAHVCSRLCKVPLQLNDGLRGLIEICAIEHAVEVWAAREEDMYFSLF